MEIKIRKVSSLVLKNGSCPFEEWIECLGDNSFIKDIDARITRLRDGNFGDHKNVGKGVFELRIHKGPGLRIYYGLEGADIVILLVGGSKGTQNKDIKYAQKLWNKYKNEN